MTQVFEPLLPRKRRDDVIERIRRVLSPQTTPAGAIIAYHLGFADRDGNAKNPASGELMWSSLCLWAAEACGGEAEDALELAVAVELLRGFLQIHHEIQEGMRFRDGRETALEIWGLGQAVNAGDALHGLAISLLLGNAFDQAVSLRIFTRVARAVNRQIAYRRSGALMGAGFEGAADTVGSTEWQRRTFRKVGRHLGRALQQASDGQCAAALASARELLAKCPIESALLDRFDEMAEYIAKKSR
jgi:geranylgeranyl pyrophosphate synthase